MSDALVGNVSGRTAIVASLFVAVSSIILQD